MREDVGYWANEKGFIHRQIAEAALGRPLPARVQIHHVDGNKKNNSPSNLVICPNHEYHALLHRRQDAIDAGAPAHYRKCHICKEFDDPDSLYIQDRGKKGPRVRHRACHTKSELSRKGRE